MASFSVDPPTEHVVVLVPRRDDHGPRDATWAFVRGWWGQHFPDWPIYEGHHDFGLFNRSAAINTAADLAGEWDVALVVDSDVLAHPPSIAEAVGLASKRGAMVLPFSLRLDLDAIGSRRIERGYRGAWEPHVIKRYYSMCSGIAAVPRKLWDDVGGFDPAFQGWGFEDNAFAAACETFSHQPVIRLPGNSWHLEHPTQKDGGHWRNRNQALADLYIAAKGNPDAIRSVRNGIVQVLGHSRIPKTFLRTCRARIDQRYEGWWKRLKALHPGWAFKTWREPVDPAEFPLTSPLWPLAENGAQKADMIRLEALRRFGGIYVDEDCEPFRSLAPLLQVSAFAGWEDAHVIPNAVIGAIPNHPAIVEAIALMMGRLPGPTWPAGPGVTTEVFRDRDDLLVLPPEAFYPVHYRDPQRTYKMAKFDASVHPATFLMHHYAGSWLSTPTPR